MGGAIISDLAGFLSLELLVCNVFIVSLFTPLA